MVIPDAEILWQGVSLPALAPHALEHTRIGVYIFRVTQGKDVYGKPLFKVETRNIFGLIDDFCELYTEDFQSKEDAFNFLKTCHNEAEKEYLRLEQKQKERIENYDR